MTMAHHPLSLITFSLQFSNIIYTPKNTVNTFSSQPSCAHNKRFMYALPTWPFTVTVFIQQSHTTNTRWIEECSLVFGILGSSKLELDSLYFRSYPITPRIHPFIPRRTVTTTLPTTPSPCYLSSKLQHFYTPSSPFILLLLRLLLISSPTYHHFTRLTKTYRMQFSSLPQALVLFITHIQHLFNLP